MGKREVLTVHSFSVLSCSRRKGKLSERSRRVIKFVRSPCTNVQSCEQDLNTFLCFYRAKQDNGGQVNQASDLHAANVFKALFFVLAC